MSSQSLPGVAQSVRMFCKKCDIDRPHRVLAHVSSTSAKTECEICKSKQTYKMDLGLNGALRVVRKLSSGAKTTRAALGSHEAWTQLKNKIGSDQPVGYVPTGSFVKDATIAHPTFGIGYVVMSSLSKIEVVFQDAKRTLIHNVK